MGENKELLNDAELSGVSGGRRSASKTAADSYNKKKEFESAWATLGMEARGYTGMKRAELYDEWELAGFTPDAVTFLSQA